ncbi:MAG: hypothetical protein AAGA56_04810 [Myxococcota bacterium]
MKLPAQFFVYAVVFTSCTTEVDVVPPEPPPLEPVELPSDPCREAWTDVDSCCGDRDNTCAWLPEGSSGVCISAKRNCYDFRLDDNECPQGYTCRGDPEILIDGWCRRSFGLEDRSGGLGYCVIEE